MEVLICREHENKIENISVSGVGAVLGSEKHTQRVIMKKAGYRLCIWYSEDSKGKQRTIKLSDGEKITVKSTFIIVHDEYGAYKNIKLDDIGQAIRTYQAKIKVGIICTKA